MKSTASRSQLTLTGKGVKWPWTVERRQTSFAVFFALFFRLFAEHLRSYHICVCANNPKIFKNSIMKLLSVSFHLAYALHSAATSRDCVSVLSQFLVAALCSRKLSRNDTVIAQFSLCLRGLSSAFCHEKCP
jgi:hypothetical protein